MSKKYHRGRVKPVNQAELIAESNRKHGHRLRALVTPTAPTFNWLTLGKVPPVHDQGQCGSCWDFSGTGTATMALIQTGEWPADGSQYFSEQYYLDCVNTDGCNGDDNTTVLIDILANGAPTEAYGPYQGQGGRCNTSTTTPKFKIAAWGYADGNGGQGVTSTADIKEALVTYGPVGCAVAAGDDWDNYTTGTITGTSTDIDHDVMLVGWDDTHDNGDGTTGAWYMRNSWGTSWGISGYAWIKYGADSIGTETVWARGAVPDPTPTPFPPTPGPTPTPTPTPPSPVPPTPTGTTYSLYGATLVIPTGMTVEPLSFLRKEDVIVSSATEAYLGSGWVLASSGNGATTVNWAAILQALLAEEPEIIALVEALIAANTPVPTPTPTPATKGAINWAQILAALAADSPEIIALIEALLAASKSDVVRKRLKATDPGTIVSTPTSVGDFINNGMVAEGILEEFVTIGFTDATSIAAVTAFMNNAKALGAANVSAYAAAQTPPLSDTNVEYVGQTYYVDEETNPPVLVVAPIAPDAGTIPVTITTLPPTS